MNTDKISGRLSDERLFENNTREELKRWCKRLNYFHYMRARGGHNCEGDAFCAYFRYDDKDDLINKLAFLDVKVNPIEQGMIAFDPLDTYSFDDLDKIRITIPEHNDLEQPQNVNICGHKAHVWVQNGRFEISISGTGGRGGYQVSDADFEVCCILEERFDQLGWKTLVDKEIKSYAHCVSEERYPELYTD